jgi:signal transduction histidine kinase
VRPQAEGTPAAPQPGLDDVEELAAPLRAAGLQVVVTRAGVPCPLPAGVDLSAYRIVQEALTNTLRHARATLAEVTFRYGADAIEIDVVDDGRAAPARVGSSQGYGLIGMRERAALVGGTLETGPTSHGGYRVHARLPLELAR